MLLNKKPFKIYDSDDENSIKDRIYYVLKSTEFWTFIKVNDNLPFIESQDITAINILEDLKKRINTFESFKDIESQYSYWIDYKNNSELNCIKELGKMYIIFFLENQEEDFMNVNLNIKIILEEFLSDNGGTEFDWNFIEQVINDSNTILKNLEQDKKLLITKVLKKEEFLKQANNNFQKQSIDIDKTDFKITSIVETMNIKTEKAIVLTHVLNNLEIENLLFARYDKFFKVNEDAKLVFKNYDYDYEDSDNTLFIVFYTVVNKKKYVFREIKIKELSPFEFIVDIDTMEDKINLVQLKSILLNIDFEVLNVENTKIKGEFLILNQNFHKELFLDEIMNNEKFFNLYVNERIKVNKNFSKINLYLYSIKTNSVSFSMSNENSNLKIKVNKILSNQYIDYFVLFITSLFKHYKERENMLYNIYKKYIPGISLSNDKITEEDDEESKIVKEKNPNILRQKNPLAQAEPTLFVPLYTRKCAKPPRILEDGEVVPKGFNIMTFPKFNEGNLKARKYICDKTGNYKYPGVRKNTLVNKEVFKYIPCCYETNQELRETSPLNIYISGKEQDKNEKYEHILYKTSRVIPNENKGILPIGLADIFPSDSTRRGVYVGPNSFIDCISRICNINADDILNEKSRQITLKNIRKQLKPEYCSQDNSDMDNYIEWFNDVNLYFEPRRFYKCLEEYFKINIYIFEKSVQYVDKYNSDDNSLVFRKTFLNDGVLSIPNVPKIGTYLDSKKYNRSAFIFVHMGGAVDSLKNPHCEYILVDKKYIQEINKTVDRIYRNLLIHSHTDRYFQGNEDFISTQFIDSTGRVVRFLTKNNEVIKFKDPIEPIGVKIQKMQYKPEHNLMSDYIKMKRLARVFLEYCMIKYAEKNNINNDSVENFIEDYSIIIPDFKYNTISSNYTLEYYKTIFLKNGKLVFDSQDTKDRIIYSMNILKNRNGLKRFISKPYIYSFFEFNKDFDGLVLDEKSFKIYAYDKNQGLALNNYIQDLDVNLVIVRENFNIDLNGYFGVFYSKEELNSKITLKNKLQTAIFDFYYLFDDGVFKKYNVSNGIGRIVIVYKINSITYFLGKYSEI